MGYDTKLQKTNIGMAITSVCAAIPSQTMHHFDHKNLYFHNVEEIGRDRCAKSTSEEKRKKCGVK